MLPEWIPAYEQHERKLPSEVKDKLLQASARTLDRLLHPLRAGGAARSLTRPGTLLRWPAAGRWTDCSNRCGAKVLAAR